MTDKEKVINTLEHCIYECFDDCPYEYGGAVTLKYCHSDLMRDALELLKEQEWQIKNRDESIEKAQEEIKWLRRMLKAQEPIPCGEKIKAGDVVLDFYECGYCKNAIRKPWMYCPYCGRKVKWDGLE